MRRRIIIVGAGPAGLSLARALAGSCAEITLVERQPREALADPQPDGREIALTHASVRHLRTLGVRSEEHTSKLQSLMRISYAVFCLKKKKKNEQKIDTNLSDPH